MTKCELTELLLYHFYLACKLLCVGVVNTER